MKRFKHIVITGVSYVGKTFIANLILQQEPEILKCITGTTRFRRSSEVDGRDYFFFTPEEFLDLESKGYFIETNSFLKNADGSVNKSSLYGTPKGFVEKYRKERPILFVVDPKGAKDLKDYLGDDCITVFIDAENEETLMEHLAERKDYEVEQEIQLRLDLAKQQLETKDTFDYCLINYQGIENAKELAAKIISLAALKVTA